MKKILLYTDTPQTGGAELQMFLLAKFLNKQKFTPILACSNFKELGKWCENFEKEGIKVIRLNVKSKHDIHHFSQLKRILAAEKIDILHIHVWNPASGRYAFFAGSSANIPIITTEHDPFELSKIKDIFKRMTLKKISKIVTVSNNNKKIIESLYPKYKEKIEVIHNGIDTTWWHSQLLRFTEEDLKKIKTEIFQANKDTLMIITVAELHERKGLKYLIQAIPEVVKSFPNVKLAIVGEGADRKNLENLIKKLKISQHVILLGKHKEIPKLLKSSNIFVLPSIREAFGLVNLEAMTIPLPVIATKVGGIPEVVKNKETGLIVEPENSVAISQALITLIKNPVLRETLAKKGFEQVYKLFNAKIMAEKYEKLYDEISKKSSRK